jgi:hypothetical protein
MKLIIDIPKEKYDWIINRLTLDRNFRECKIIPLPKGHGDLIDRSKLVYDCSFNEYGCDSICHCDNCSYHTIKETTINKAPTIIEADKAERE